MEREQIIKALECCTYGGDITKSQVEVCSPCPYFYEGNCTDMLKENALALITSQEQRIKELTEENERLKATKYMAYPDGRIEMIPTIESVKANTVREMQEQLKMEIGRFGREGCSVSKEVIFWFIDQIAKEMLEGE